MLLYHHISVCQCTWAVCHVEQLLSYIWSWSLAARLISEQQFWDQTSCRSVVGFLHLQRAPGLLPAHNVSGERVEIFLRCLFDRSLTVLWLVIVSTVLSVYVMSTACVKGGLCECASFFVCVCVYLCVCEKLRQTGRGRKTQLVLEWKTWINK